ncbi:uncharacterized protein LOC106093208 [Stomoxys calcitrans]|uniref:uncharacterized protein LOC106093208 n=1 Tax=Stomoxys calcitrans TaxID=35570 RepID=UPI0027E2B01A|nr:uncharacterized protein LOC106093208 [Stomoxys calcitrans]
MNFKGIFFLLFVAQLFITTETARRRFQLVLNNLTCNILSPLVKRFDCDFKKFATSRYALDANFLLRRDFNQNAEIHALIYFTPAKAKRAVKFMDLKLNICNMLTTAMSMPLARIILDESRRTSNLPYECPVRGDLLYTFNNYSISAETLPPYFPLMTLNFSLFTYDNQELIAEFLLEGTTLLR